MKDELITVSQVGKPNNISSYSRNLFYDEQFSDKADTSIAVHVVAVFVITTTGEILLQKRSSTKRHNPRLIDKTLGGHITFGDNPDYTVMVETVQELLTPSIVLKNDDDFAKTFGLLKNYLNTVALIKHNKVVEMPLAKIVNDKKYIVNNVVHTYFGIYDGSTKPADKESAGMLYYKIEELDDEIDQDPEQFTDDLKTLFKLYRTNIMALRHKYGRYIYLSRTKSIQFPKHIWS